MIKIDNVMKKFGDKVLYDKLSYEINKGDFVAVTGESGSGKSTLLNMLGMLDRPDKGKIYFEDEELPEINSKKGKKLLYNRFAFIFQNYFLLENQTVDENFDLIIDQNSKKSKDEVLQYVGLFGFNNKKVYELSGGEQQRVAIARTLLKSFDVLLCDEPTGNLDEKNKHIVMDLLYKLNKDGVTIIIVTHDSSILQYVNKKLEIK